LKIFANIIDVARIACIIRTVNTLLIPRLGTQGLENEMPSMTLAATIETAMFGGPIDATPFIPTGSHKDSGAAGYPLTEVIRPGDEPEQYDFSEIFGD
jgi:hypothetical protein